MELIETKVDFKNELEKNENSFEQKDILEI
jgi:hypothetical protein